MKQYSNLQFWNLHLRSIRPMRLQERMDLTHRQGNPLLGLLPRVHTHFCLRREHSAFHRHLIWVRRDIVRENQQRILALAHEIARDGVDEVDVFVHFGAIVISGRRLTSSGPQLIILLS